MSHVVTNQKQAILESLEGENCHPTAPEIFGEVKKDLPRISRATVYRNLDNLCEEGKVTKVFVAGTNRFELSKHAHSHFVCDSCNKILDIKINIPKLDVGMPKNISIQGVCNKCRGK